MSISLQSIKRIGIVPFIGLALFVFIGILITVMPSLNQQYRRLQGELSGLDEETKRLNELSGAYSRYKSTIETLTLALPGNDVEFASFAQTLSTIASQSGVSIKINSEDDPHDEKRSSGVFRKAATSIVISGAFPQIEDFYKRFENTPYYFGIDELSVEGKEEGIESDAKIIIFMR